MERPPFAQVGPGHAAYETLLRTFPAPCPGAVLVCSMENFEAACRSAGVECRPPGTERPTDGSA